jgi:hypothetical protein
LEDCFAQIVRASIVQEEDALTDPP